MLPEPPTAPGKQGAGDEAPAFVTSETCRSCHADAFDAWRGSHHDLAMQPASDRTVLGDFSDVVFSHRGVDWRFFRDDGGFVVHTQGPDGEPTDFEVAYTFGAAPLQQYLVALPGGRLQALTVAWDTRPEEQGGQRWFSLHPDQDVPPGDVLHWSGPANRWNAMCAHCHSTNLRKGFREARASYDTTWSEPDVACEACHGPGSRHVAWAEGGADAAADDGLRPDLGGDGARWVMDPASGIARRDPPRIRHTEVLTCAPCHSRRALLDEAPAGADYLDHFHPALLREGLYFADGQIRDEVYVHGSFLQSGMFAAGVTCSDCHDPHALGLRAEGDGLCGRCHAPARFADASHHHHPETSPGARCVSCHMPARTYMEIDARRDHSFRIPRPDLTLGLGTPNACNGCHADRDPAWAARTVAAWFPEGRGGSPHFGEALHRAWEGAPGASAALIALARSPAAPAIARASAVELLVGHPGPAPAGAIAEAARDAEPLLRLAAAGASAALPPAERAARVARLLGDPVASVRMEAARVLADVPAAALSASQREARRRGLRAYREAQALDADRPQAHVNLAALERALGEPARAERALRRAIAVGPYFVPAWVNLADLQRAQGRDADAERVLREGLAAVPDGAEAAPLHHSLGLTLVRLGRKDEALEPLRRAAQLDPGPRFAYVHGVALHGTGATERAVEVLEEVAARHPHHAPTLEALVALHREAGRAQAAGRYERALRALSQAADAEARAP